MDITILYEAWGYQHDHIQRRFAELLASFPGPAISLRVSVADDGVTNTASIEELQPRFLNDVLVSAQRIVEEECGIWICWDDDEPPGGVVAGGGESWGFKLAMNVIAFFGVIFSPLATLLERIRGASHRKSQGDS